MTKKIPKTKWQALPAKDWSQWFSEYIMSSLVLKFYHKHKRFPTHVKPNSARLRKRLLSVEFR